MAIDEKISTDGVPSIISLKIGYITPLYIISELTAEVNYL